VRVAELRGCDDPRSDWTERVERLASIPLLSLAELQIARAEIVGDRVSEDVVERLVRADVASRLPNNDREFDLPVDLTRDRRIDPDIFIRSDDAACGLLKRIGLDGLCCWPVTADVSATCR
jgi:hypothetical protein